MDLIETILERERRRIRSIAARTAAQNLNVVRTSDHLVRSTATMRIINDSLNEEHKWAPLLEALDTYAKVDTILGEEEVDLGWRPVCNCITEYNEDRLRAIRRAGPLTVPRIAEVRDRRPHQVTRRIEGRILLDKNIRTLLDACSALDHISMNRVKMR